VPPDHLLAGVIGRVRNGRRQSGGAEEGDKKGKPEGVKKGAHARKKENTLHKPGCATKNGQGKIGRVCMVRECE